MPLRVETRWGGPATSYAVRKIETLPERSGDFSAPAVLPGPEPEAYKREPTPIAPEAADKVVAGALAVGSSFHGLGLTKVVETKLSTIFEPKQHRDPLVSSGLEFTYGSGNLLAH